MVDFREKREKESFWRGVGYDILKRSILIEDVDWIQTV